MDKKIKKKTWTLKRIALGGAIALFVGFVVYQLFFTDRRSKLKVEKDKITISTVEMGVFQDRIPNTGIVEPLRSVFLDAVEGGSIKSITAESGAILKKGDEIMELSNLNRELQVLQQEAQLNQSINELRQTRLQLTQNDLQQQQTLAEVDMQLAKLVPQYKRQKTLYEKNLVSRQDYESVEADYLFNLRRRDITYASYKNDSLERIRQLKDLNTSERKMMLSLDGAGRILDNLIIRAPIDGQLSRPQLEVGQAVTVGQRLGQVDEVGSYKVRVPIDELYLPRITEGLKATTPYAGKEYELVITYVYPTIQNGRFDVDMRFTGETPDGIRRGGSLRLRIELGQSSEELLLPVGGFYKDSGGNWVFVVEPNGNRAVRRDIKLGRKNTEFYEVLEGLKPGDRVITSSYENFGNNEVLILN